MALPSPPGNFVKLMILSFADSAYTQSNGDPYIALINPQSINMDFKIEHSSQNQAQGQTAPPAQLLRVKPSTLTFDFLFDTTGVVLDLNPSHQLETVSDQIAEFMDLTFNYDGDAHDTPFLKIVWGPTLFKGKFTSVAAHYKLFDPTGTPVRAVLTCEFEQSTTPADQSADTAQQSPDLTHSRVVQAGDTLPLLCYSIYQDSSYYLQVAEVNNLANFRKLQVGSTIYFPPLV